MRVAVRRSYLFTWRQTTKENWTVHVEPHLRIINNPNIPNNPMWTFVCSWKITGQICDGQSCVIPISADETNGNISNLFLSLEVGKFYGNFWSWHVIRPVLQLCKSVLQLCINWLKNDWRMFCSPRCSMFSTTLFRIVTLIADWSGLKKGRTILLTKLNIEQCWRQTLFSFVSSTRTGCAFFGIYCDFLIHATESIINECWVYRVLKGVKWEMEIALPPSGPRVYFSLS